MSGRSRRISTTISINDWADEAGGGGFRKRKQSVTLMLSNSALITTDMSQSRILRINNKSKLNKPLYREDIFFTGSLHAVPEDSLSNTNINVGNLSVDPLQS